MLEIEAKIRVGALEPVRVRLRALGAEHLGMRVERDAYYNAPHRDFAETDEALRVRYSEPVPAAGMAPAPAVPPVLTYKGPKLGGGGPKSREEICVTVAEGDLLEQVLERLGFRRTAIVVKERDLYRVERFTIALDTVEGLGTFIEIEAPMGLPRAEAVRRITQISETLGVRGESLSLSYLEMLLSKEKGS
ncbi:MAG: class IV adenylate cyclase [Methanomicrobiales archaeon]|nr:class IV adenylate cyclase [Methanomicrobiales archaeon]MDD1655736.1 class IV adenylate cyclase [Methanomicrobiales archaeon]